LKITYVNTIEIWRKFTPQWRRAGNENMNLFEDLLVSNKFINNYMPDVNLFEKASTGIWPVDLKNNYVDSLFIEGDVLLSSALSPDMVSIAFKAIKYNPNQKRVLWIVDGWKKYWNEWLSLINEHKIDFVFCAYLENVNWLKQKNIKCAWLPFAIEPTVNSFANSKPHDIVQMGRVRGDYDDILLNSNLVYKKSNSFKKWIFFKKSLSYKEYCQVLALSKFTLSYPSGYELDKNTRDEILGFIPTNMRWYEAMAAKSLPIGEIPTDEEFRLLFPEDKTYIVETNPESIVDSIEKISDEERRRMTESNYNFIIKNHTYQKRVEFVINQINEWMKNDK
jgi:hypothetical protein